MNNIFGTGMAPEVLEFIESMSGKLSKSSAEHIIYTMRHKRAIMILNSAYGSPYGEKGVMRLLYHDIDKLFMYGVLNDTKLASKYHKQISIHHSNNWLCGDYFARYETVLDYESARFTKPDKPLNAYETIMKYHPKTYSELKPFLQQLNIDSPVHNDTQLAYATWGPRNEDELVTVTIDILGQFFYTDFYKRRVPLETLLYTYNKQLLL